MVQGNPLVDGVKTRRPYARAARLDFLVDMDLYITPQLARDIVLPAALGHSRGAAQDHRALYERRTDERFYVELARLNPEMWPGRPRGVA